MSKSKEKGLESIIAYKVPTAIKDKFREAAKDHEGGMSGLLNDLIEQQVGNNALVLLSVHKNVLGNRDNTINGLKDKILCQESTITEQANTIRQLENDLDAGRKLQETALEAFNSMVSPFAFGCDKLNANFISTCEDEISKLHSDKNQLSTDMTRIAKVVGANEPAAESIIKKIVGLLEKGIEKVDALKTQLKQVASHLGVPDTAKHIIQRIEEIRADAERITSLESEIESISAHLGVSDTSEHIIQRIEEIRAEVRSHIDALKQRISQLKELVEKKHRQLCGYKTQGYFSRLFNETPEPTGRIIWNGNKPEDETLDISVIGINAVKGESGVDCCNEVKEKSDATDNADND